MVPIVGQTYTSLYYCCKSFPVLLHDVNVGGWIASYVLIVDLNVPGLVSCVRVRTQNFLFHFPFDEIYRRLLVFALGRSASA